MDEILKEGIKKGDWCIMVAFGAGLSAHAFLLRKA
jgi:3-oxoacyl-[acyl-carrier-protein] synthase III